VASLSFWRRLKRVTYLLTILKLKTLKNLVIIIIIIIIMFVYRQIDKTQLEHKK